MAIGRSNAHVEITASASKFGTGLRDAKKKLGAFGSETRSMFRSVGGAIAKVGGGIAAGLGLAGGFGLADVIGDVLGVEKALTRFQIAGERTPAQMDALRQSMSEVAKVSGISRGELVAGASAYVALTGDAEGAANAMGLFAKVSNATGASMDDIAATAASMRDNLKIDPKDFEAAFSALHVQGKAGAVELRELATVMAGVAPQFSKFDGGSGTAGLAELGATLQVLRKDFGSTSEAATGARALFGSLVRGSGKLKALGVDVFDAEGNKRNFTQIIDEILAKDISEPVLQKILGSDEALRSIGALRTHRTLLTDITKASKDQNAIERDAATYRESTAGKLSATMEALKVAVADVFTPERIQKMADAMVGFVSAVAGAVEWVGKLDEKLGEIMGKFATEQSWFSDLIGGVTGVNVGGIGAAVDAGFTDENGNRGWRASLDREAAAEAEYDKKLAAQRVRADMRVAEAQRLGVDTSQADWRQQATAAAVRKNPVVVPDFRAPAQDKPMSIYLQVDGNAMAAAVVGARDNRRTPGGK